MHRLILIAGLLFVQAVSPAARAQGDAIRFEVAVVPGVQRYADLLERPGYLAVILENNELSPSVSSKLKISEGGRSAEIRNAVIRFTGRKSTVYSYEAGVSLGIADSTLTFPVAVDVAGAASGKIVLRLTPPLAKLIPTELIDRIRIKTQLVANVAAQRKVLDYLDQKSGSAPKTKDLSILIEAILIDAFNRSGAPAAQAGGDAGDAPSLSERWLLYLTLAVWLIVVPTVLLAQRIRKARRHAA